MPNWNRITVKELRNDCVDMHVRKFDYSEGYGEAWDVIQPTGVFEDGHERYEKYEEPMMNFWYPLPDRMQFDAYHADLLADNVAMCLVYDEKNDVYGLALTGGGMDMSWDIAEAYILLGFLPPAYIRLPRFAGEKLTKKNRVILSAMSRSYRILRGWMDANLRDLRRTREYMR